MKETTKKMATEKVLFVFDPVNCNEQINNYYQLCLVDYVSLQADSIEKAKLIINSKQIDLVISSMDLPDGTGIDLHKYIAENHQDIIRFLYSENSDKDVVYKSAGYIHQFMNHETKPNQFMHIIDNAFGLKEVLANKDLHKRLSGITNLPSPPEIYNQLTNELQCQAPSIHNIANIIKKDVSITAKVLHMVNSAYFGLSAHVENPLHAVNLLGIDTIQSMVLTAGVFNLFKDPGIPGYSIESIYNNSLAVGTSSRHLANAFGLMTKHTEDALMAGMLHDIGKLVMLSYFPNEFKQSVELSEREAIPLFEAEKQIVGVNDAEIGAHLLSLWGLPNSILEAIALHYTPQKAQAPITNVLTAVHLGYALNHDIVHNIKEETESAVDMDYLEQLNLSSNIESLKNFCMSATV